MACCAYGAARGLSAAPAHAARSAGLQAGCQPLFGHVHANQLPSGSVQPVAQGLFVAARCHERCFFHPPGRQQCAAARRLPRASGSCGRNEGRHSHVGVGSYRRRFVRLRRRCAGRPAICCQRCRSKRCQRGIACSIRCQLEGGRTCLLSGERRGAPHLARTGRNG